MEREIKFRAFDPSIPKMTKGRALKESCELARDMGDWYWDDSIVIMQYIGLKDINGKDIYEGDIVNVMMEDGEKTELVSFDATMGLYDPYLEGSNEYFYTLHQLVNHHGARVEVIGNIYETPELLKEAVK